jgi:DNA-directed RNA polymerase subunit omega
MLDDLKEEEIVNKVGGRFKLSTLIQKRMVALNTGAKPLVEMNSTDKMAVVLQEILQDKIYLDSNWDLQTQSTNLTASANLPSVYLGGGNRGVAMVTPEALPPSDGED